jgi:hypothetical protein
MEFHRFCSSFGIKKDNPEQSILDKLDYLKGLSLLDLYKEYRTHKRQHFMDKIHHALEFLSYLSKKDVKISNFTITPTIQTSVEGFYAQPPDWFSIHNEVASLGRFQYAHTQEALNCTKNDAQGDIIFRHPTDLSHKVQYGRLPPDLPFRVEDIDSLYELKRICHATLFDKREDKVTKTFHFKQCDVVVHWDVSSYFNLGSEGWYLNYSLQEPEFEGVYGLEREKKIMNHICNIAWMKTH